MRGCFRCAGAWARRSVYGPPDDAGCDDLLKHPGLLDFSHTVTPFVVFELQGLRVTPLPLNHSKLTFGYLLESAHSRVAALGYRRAAGQDAEVFTQQPPAGDDHRLQP